LEKQNPFIDEIIDSSTQNHKTDLSTDHSDL